MRSPTDDQTLPNTDHHTVSANVAHKKLMQMTGFERTYVRC